MVLTVTIFCGKVINDSLWCLGTVVSLRTGNNLFYCCDMAVESFLVFNQKTCQICLFYYSAHHKLFTIHSSQQHSNSFALCPCFFAAWSLDVHCQIKSGKVRPKMEKMKCCLKWDGTHRVFSVHTLRYTKMLISKI